MQIMWWNKADFSAATTPVFNIINYIICTFDQFNASLYYFEHIRSRLRNEVANLDQQGGGSRYIMGSGKDLNGLVQLETFNLGSFLSPRFIMFNCKYIYRWNPVWNAAAIVEGARAEDQISPGAT